MDCPVCYDEINDTIPLSCGHWVCRLCIVKSQKMVCPLCRQSLQMNTQEYWYIRYLIRSKIFDKK